MGRCFPLKLMEKDPGRAQETGGELRLSVPVVGAAKEVLGVSVSAGTFREDFSPSIRHLGRAAGVPVPSRRP
jgi:3-hydroxyisobutyrate dehydrogenase-like beta-hydroxyacid dehydrogenase